MRGRSCSPGPFLGTVDKFLEIAGRPHWYGLAAERYDLMGIHPVQVGAACRLSTPHEASALC